MSRSATSASRPSLSALPPLFATDVLPAIRAELAASARTLVVLDDDPTGTQTVYDVPVITHWDLPSLVAEFTGAARCFYVLTNSRSLPEPEARALAAELAINLRIAAQQTGRAFTLVSRSDSTLRGHFPVETDALADVTPPYDATVLFPYFEAGGRYTIDDIHYVAEAGHLVPAAETPFARDRSFGYRQSDLRSWIEEKTAGRVRASDVASISLTDLRSGGPDHLTRKLCTLPTGIYVVVNAAAPRDAEVFALASLRAEREGRRFLYRTAASFVVARLGLAPRPLLSGNDFRFAAGRGGLIVAGSYVPKTTAQLEALKAATRIHVVELDVETLLAAADVTPLINRLTADIEAALASGSDVLLATSRKLIACADAAANLAIGRRVSDTLVAIVRGLHTPPRFLIAKGGISSSDIATRALGVTRALVRGQLLPGVPVWRLGAEARFPGIDYVVFPGNVGGEHALADAVRALSLS